MPEAFDSGPLSWVKDEIDQSLQQVLTSFNAVRQNPGEVASLRMSLAPLYQASGALDMVGLEGCKRFCSALENITSRLEKQSIAVTDALMESMIHAVETLSQYLQDLINGAPDTPTRLYASLKPLTIAQDESLEESDLFYPDTTHSAPKSLTSKLVEESVLPSFVASQRMVFQKSLLDWLRTKEVDALNHMRTALLNVQQAQHKQSQITLWWAATAFADALAQNKIAASNSAKKLCRRLDHQLRLMAEGEPKYPSQLLRDVLYFVALSERNTPLIAQVKEVFELDCKLPPQHLDMVSALTTDAERAAIAMLKADLPNLKELWVNISDATQVEARDASFKVLNEKLANLDIIQKSIQNANLIAMLKTTKMLLEALASERLNLSDAVLIEVAAALNLFDYISEHYQQLNTDIQQKMATQTLRLQSILSGETLTPALEAFATDTLDASVTNAVTKQILAALQNVETALDSFFRDANNLGVLDDTYLPLQQVSAAFEMLDMPVAKSIAQLSTAYVNRFKANVAPLDEADFELVAESLSMLGLYAQELPHVRNESVAALAEAVQRLQAGLDAMLVSEDADSTVTPADQQLNLAQPELVIPDQPVAPVLHSVSDQALDPELEGIFLTEAEDVLAALAQHLQALRVNATNTDALSEVRRAYHTLKGSGRTVGLTAMGEVAWSVEQLLNVVMERQVLPSSPILAFIEKVTASFANWVAHLQAHHQVTLVPEEFTKQAAELIQVLEHELTLHQPVKQKEEVLIGGTRKLSKAFFNIFLAEAQQHLSTLISAHQQLVEDSSDLPTDDSRRAAHTLGSNALTAGFKPTGELARALEHWLDAHTGVWTSQHLALYANTVNALADGLEKAKALKNPKSTRALIKTLTASTAAMQAETSQHAEAAMLETQLLEQAPSNAALETQPTSIDPNTTRDNEAQVLPVASAIEATEPIVSQYVTRPVSEHHPDDELLALFAEEARELMPQIGQDLRGWRTNPQAPEYADSLQRALHTLKGSARMAGQAAVGDGVHHMEDLVIRALKQNIGADDFEEMFAEYDRIGYQLEEISGGLSADLTNLQTSKKVVNSTRSAERKTQFMRMRADVLDRLINEAGEVSIARSRMEREMQNFKQSSTDLTDSVSRLRTYLRELEIEAETQLQSRMSLLQEAHETFDPLEFDRFTRLQELTRLMAESVNDVATIQHGLLLNLDQTNAALQQQNRMNRELQQGLMGVRMLPFSSITERLQRIVRQTARELDKQVELHIAGETVELDRSVLDKMGAPLEHLLRNAVAHGLETPAMRTKAGKSEVGQITLKVSLDNEEIKLEITDDGAGIDLEKVKQKAIANGLLSDTQNITEQALMTLIFEPGFTTADAVSQIAGRGVGLDVVRSEIAALSGRIDVSNVQGAGAAFNVHLPVTLSVAQVVMVRAGTRVFAIPSVMVEQVQKLKQDSLLNAYEAQKIEWANHAYPLQFLSRLVGDNDHVAQHHSYTPVILLRSGTYRNALHVDEIIGNQEVVMKPIGSQLAHVPGMIGATVLGDGAIVLVINPVQLANREALSRGAIQVQSATPVLEPAKKLVLVVDDSLTMRKVLSRVLERDNFEVITANDGMDAVMKLQTITPDIILTDIEMPRMDGFEFARHVRDNPNTINTPLVVISSRTAEKHRQVAAQIGVNAFLGKPVQDEDLLKQVHSLL